LTGIGPLLSVNLQVPTIGHYLIDMEKYFSDAYDALYLKKQRCDIAMATPFPNEELCGHKICQYYAPQHKKKEVLTGLYGLGLCEIKVPTVTMDHH